MLGLRSPGKAQLPARRGAGLMALGRVPDDEEGQGPEDDNRGHHGVERGTASSWKCSFIGKIELDRRPKSGTMQATTCMHPRTRTRHRAPARQLLLAAAARVFARDGLEGATTRAIAREAGVNEVTLFRHFKTKEGLIEAVVGSQFGSPSGAAARAGRPGASLREDLAAFARRYEGLLMANLPLILTMIGEIRRHADCEHQALKGIFWPMRAALVERLRLAAASGEARPDLNPALSADVFSGAIFSSVIRSAKRLGRREYTDAQYREAWLELFLGGIAPQ